MKPDVTERRYEQIVIEMMNGLEAQGTLTDTKPGSVVRTLIEAFAREMREAYAGLGVIWEMTHIDTASGQGLDELVALLGVQRQKGQVLVGEVTFRRQTQVAGAVVLPQGTLVQALGQENAPIGVFRTEQPAELAAGQPQVTVKVQMPLGEGQVLPEWPWQVKLLQPLAGIGAIAMAYQPAPRGYNESDDELRSRVKGILDAAGGGTAKALERVLLESGQVSAVAFREPPAPDLPPGMLEVLVKDPRDFAEIQRLVEKHKAPGIVVRVKEIGVRRLELTLVVQPAGANLSGKERQELTAAVQTAVAGLVRGLRTGEKLVWNRVLTAVMNVPGVLDLNPASRVRIDGGASQVPGAVLPEDLQPLERVELVGGRPAVELAGEPTVFVRILCRKESLSASDKTALVEALKAELADVLKTGATSLTYSKLLGALAARVSLKAGEVRFRVRAIDAGESVLKAAGDTYNLGPYDLAAPDSAGPDWAPDDASWGDLP